MKRIKLFEEFKGEFANEVITVYKSKDLVILIPKTEFASCVIGNKTKWCSASKGTSSMFNEMKKNSLLFRFLFKNGNKIRLTYTFPTEKYSGKIDWGNKEGTHIIIYDINPEYKGEIDVFQLVEDDRTKANQKEHPEFFETLNTIPQEAKDKVNEFIKNANTKDTYNINGNKEINILQKDIDMKIKQLLEEFQFRYNSNIQSSKAIKYTISDKITYDNLYNIEFILTRSGYILFNKNRVTLQKLKSILEMAKSNLKNLNAKNFKFDKNEGEAKIDFENGCYCILKPNKYIDNRFLIESNTTMISNRYIEDFLKAHRMIK